MVEWDIWGAISLFFMDLLARSDAIWSSTVAIVMLAASFDLVEEGQKYGGGTWVVLHIVASGFLIICYQNFLVRLAR